MNRLDRLQILTEMIREYKTSILNDHNKEKVGEEVLEIIQSAGDEELFDKVASAKLKQDYREQAVKHLDEATDYLHKKIEEELA
ncbi:hypothetical protein [Pseudalkalibacillus caeni]|uniref:Uncharacterized protein n=1 Tax=Exobacillus caeni TaxID=2574798 RepID=A0A5R9F5Z0_9BACL|nr:hypothetical protein [Pseudalkalibacillus caeni]TLS37909.1 hypothetical protein FCL54_08815 [Pseudalkalibacillus caeni]